MPILTVNALIAQVPINAVALWKISFANQKVGHEVFNQLA
jgi:hypothetical protein